ncbi:exonuclease domain-containing protein [Actinomadura sp. GTD37]|uniref:exonuclease domain-containing protein n=1 Tax=Actinomadura sp. GTD37 TaxID=1778030 RepID=UPI0035BECBE9
MSGWHRGALIAFDLESTGLDVENDRIVTACIALIDGTGKRPPETIDVVINPGIPIPAEAAAIHGWTTERVQTYEGAMPPADGVEFIVEMLATALLDEPSAPLVGQNIGGYDLSLLDRESRRNGVRLLEERLGARPLHVVDTFVISKRFDKYRRKPSPTQGAHILKTCAEVLGIPWDDEAAHDSTYDAVMAARVAWKMCDRKPELARMSLPELHAAQVRWKRDQTVDYGQWLRGQGRADEAERLDGSWPVRPFEAQGALL